MRARRRIARRTARRNYPARCTRPSGSAPCGGEAVARGDHLTRRERGCVMLMFESFSRYLAYGATDQQTLIELRDAYTGLLVPATIAAFQRQGTGGFVLTLSATTEAPPYVIDPRFPLFQQALAAPKKSHTALAELLDDPKLIVTTQDPSPDEFSDERIAAIARHWVEFNSGYGSKENAAFDKYAQRLGEDVRPEQAQSPEAIIAPYFACDGPDDPWWARSALFFEQTCAAADGTACLRVVCARHASAPE